MLGQTEFCDHVWERDDANCKVCVNCKKRVEVRE